MVEVLGSNLTLPASSDGDLGGDVRGRMQRPVVDDLRVVALLDPLVTVHDQLDLREVDADGVVMPLVVANLFSAGSKTILIEFASRLNAKIASCINSTAAW